MIYLNDRWLSVVGEPARRALGRPLLNLVPPACRGDFAPLLDARMGAARRKGRFRVQGEDGTVRHFDVSVVPWYADTQIAGYSGSAVDVTERVEIEERLSAQRDFSALLLEISPLPISLVDEQDRYITVNQAWEAFRGLRREDVIGCSTVSLLGPAFVTDNADEALFQLGKVALPTWMVKLLVISILTSAAASCQTTILPATRTMLSMGSHGAAPPKLAQIDRKRLTPDFSTWLFGIGSIVWYVLLVVISHNTSTDAYSASIAAVGMAIAVYYGLSGVSCILYFRTYLLTSPKNFVLMGVLPGFGGVVLLYVFGKTVYDARNADYGYGLLFGVGTVLVIGTLLLVLGLPLMFWCASKYPRFFTYRPDPSDLVKDPNSADTLAAPLGTYTKTDRRGKGN